MEYTLLKSKDDLTLEHNKKTPLYLKTGFSGTAGEAIEDENGNITLFVDPRYHIQADLETRKKQTKNKKINVVKLDMQTSFIDALKKTLIKKDTLFIPSKSTKLSTFNTFKKNLKGINILPYETEDETKKKAEIEYISNDISGKEYKEKLSNLKKLNKNVPKNILITSLEDVSYLLNLRSFEEKNTSCIKAKLLILKDKTILFSDDNIILDEIETRPLSALKDVLSKIDDEILIDKNTITLFDYNLIKNPHIMRTNHISKMSSIKTKAEINHYISAFKRLDDALYSFQGKIVPGKSEFELKEIFEKELIRHGAKGTSFKTILAVAENSSSIHYSNYDKNKIIKDGDILLLDCGGFYEGGYATDITRVFLCGNIKNNPNEDEIKKIYTAVLKAQLNVYFGDFDDTKSMGDKARKILNPYEKQGFLFPHSLGHGVGIPVHQAPPTLTPNPKYNSKLKNNMVFTIEPGLYQEGKFGIRLENTVYYDKNCTPCGKKISLSKFPYEENLIDKTMLNKQEQKWLETWQKASSKLQKVPNLALKTAKPCTQTKKETQK